MSSQVFRRLNVEFPVFHKTRRRGPKSANSTTGNLGLGLIIVREINASLDIGIRAFSAPEGTTIYMSFKKANRLSRNIFHPCTN